MGSASEGLNTARGRKSAPHQVGTHRKTKSYTLLVQPCLANLAQPPDFTAPHRCKLHQTSAHRSADRAGFVGPKARPLQRLRANDGWRTEHGLALGLAGLPSGSAVDHRAERLEAAAAELGELQL
jgi:hypothetical protein